VGPPLTLDNARFHSTTDDRDVARGTLCFRLRRQWTFCVLHVAEHHPDVVASAASAAAYSPADGSDCVDAQRPHH
jgi:hypothetical protein